MKSLVFFLCCDKIEYMDILPHQAGKHNPGMLQKGGMSVGEKEPYIPVTAQAVNKPENISLPHQDAPVKPEYMRLVDGLKTRVVAGQIVLMPTGDAVSKVRQSAVLNREAARLVELMAKDFTVDTVVEQGLHIFRVEEPVLRRDVDKLVNTLCLAGMLEGEEVKERLKNSIFSVSGTATLVNVKLSLSKTKRNIRFKVKP